MWCKPCTATPEVEANHMICQIVQDWYCYVGGHFHNSTKGTLSVDSTPGVQVLRSIKCTITDITMYNIVLYLLPIFNTLFFNIVIFRRILIQGGKTWMPTAEVKV